MKLPLLPLRPALLCVGLLAWAPVAPSSLPATGTVAPLQEAPGKGEADGDILLLRFSLREGQLLTLALSPVATHADGLAKRFLSAASYACASELDPRNVSSAALVLADGSGVTRFSRGVHWLEIRPREGLAWRDVRERLDLVVSLEPMEPPVGSLPDRR